MLSYKDALSMDKKSIEAKVVELRRELFNWKMQKAASGFDKPHKIKEAKKSIARLLTALNGKGEKK